MKSVLFFLLAGVVMLTSCAKDELLDSGQIPGLEQSDDDKSGSDSLFVDVQIAASIKSLQSSRSATIDAFMQGHEMGVMVRNDLYKFNYDGTNWKSENTPKIQEKEEIYAFFPYKMKEGGKSEIMFNLLDQPDILWSKNVITPDFPRANFEMEHKLSLIRIKFMRDEYIGEGVISNVSVNDYVDVSLDYKTGTLNRGGDKRKIELSDKFVLDDTSTQLSEFILFPRSVKGDPVQVSFVLDGEVQTFYLPDWHSWEASKIYTYTLKLKGRYNTEVNVEDVPIDVEYWSKYGKTDDIIFKEPAFDDFEKLFYIQTNYTTLGYDCFQNEGKTFGLFFTHYGVEPFKGKVRFLLTQGGKIMEKFPPKDISVQSSWSGTSIPCYVTSVPGTYQLEPVFQKEGESTWFHGTMKGTADEWMYEIFPPSAENLPALRDIFLENIGSSSIALTYEVTYDKPFNIVYILSNKGKGKLKGEIKAVWEREFKLGSNSYRPDARKEGSKNDEEWFEEIGHVQVDIEPGVRFWKGIIGCQISHFHPNPVGPSGIRYAVPVLHLYWKAEGSSEWVLLRQDADYLFNRNYQGPDIRDETKNLVNIALSDWRE